MTKEREIQESVMKMRYIEQQVTSLQQQAQDSQRAMIEFATSINALKEIKKITGDNESLVPLGAGVFIDASVKKQDSVLMDIGSGAIVEKTVDEAMKTLEKREEAMKNRMIAIDNMVRNLETQYMEAGTKVQQLQK